MRVLALVGLLSALALTLALVACGGSAPTPTAAPTPTRPAVTSTSVTWAALGKPALRADPNTQYQPGRPVGTYQLTWLAGVVPYFSGIAQLAHDALRDIPSVTFEVVDTPKLDAVSILSKNPDQWKNGALVALDPFEVDFMNRGIWPLDADGKAFKLTPAPLWAFPFAPMSCWGFATIDPAIKTIFDFNGKRVFIGRQGDPHAPAYFKLFETNNIKPSRIIQGPEQSDAVLRDRQADAVSIGTIGCYGQGPQWLQMAAQTKVYNVDFTKEAIDKAFAATGYLAFTPFKQSTKLMTQINSATYPWVDKETWYTMLTNEIGPMASPDVPAFAIYALNKTFLDHVQELKSYQPNVLSTFTEIYGGFTGKKEDFHPGMRIAMEEHGLNYGTEAIYEWIAKHE